MESVGLKETVNKGRIGYYIPARYRKYWEIRFADAKVILPRLLIEHTCDIFIHDSLHTRTHMLFEFSVARALMREGAIICSDDITWNNAFSKFLAINQMRGYSPITGPNSGIWVNEFDEYERSIGVGVFTSDDV